MPLFKKTLLLAAVSLVVLAASAQAKPAPAHDSKARKASVGHASGRVAGKPVRVVTTLAPRPRSVVLRSVRAGGGRRVASIVRVEPARPSFGQLYGLHEAADSLELKSASPW